MSDKFFGAVRLTAARGVTIRSAESEDFDLFCRWFSDPSFFEYWGGRPLSPDQVESQFFDGRDDDVLPMVVEENGLPVGYIQAWIEAERSGGVDIVLVADARGRGVGPIAIRALAAWLEMECRWTRVTADPHPDNAKSIRAFEKAGFVRERESVDSPDGPAVLM
jgi:aminoglycoside 6'-N-acetyltransferase